MVFPEGSVSDIQLFLSSFLLNFGHDGISHVPFESAFLLEEILKKFKGVVDVLDHGSVVFEIGWF